MNYSKEEELRALIGTNQVLHQQLEELRKDVRDLEKIIAINEKVIDNLINPNLQLEDSF